MFYEDKNVVETIDRPYTDYYVAVDYGTQNATVFGLLGMYGGKWYLIKSTTIQEGEKADKRPTPSMQTIYRSLLRAYQLYR